MAIPSQTHSQPARNSLAGRGSGHWPWIMAMIRTPLFALFQALIAVLLGVGGNPAAWEASIGWWPWAATLTNMVCIGLLAWLMRQEGGRLVDLYRPDRSRAGKDLLLTLGLLIISGPLVILPNIGLATLLFGDAEATVPMMFRPLPQWAALLALVVFPVTIALAELPTYFGYAMPRLATRIGGPAALLFCAAWLSVQHITLPLIFDWRFIVWRMLMFLLFALMIGFALSRRPRLLLYLMVVHGLLDLSAVAMILNA